MTIEQEFVVTWRTRRPNLSRMTIIVVTMGADDE